MRIGVLKAGGQYGALRLHAEHLAAALVDLGHAAETYDLAEAGGIAALVESLSVAPDAYVSFGGVGADLAAGPGQLLFDLSSAPFVQWHVDHPLDARDRVTAGLRNSVAFFLDQQHVEFVRAWPAAAHLAGVGFLPLGANRRDADVDVSAEAFARRDIGLLFTGTYRGEPGRRWRDLPLGDLGALLDDVADRMAGDARLPILTAAAQTMAAQARPLDAQLLGAFAPVLVDVQSFAEAYHRNRLLHVLGSAGVEISIYGKGWEPLIGAYRSFEWGGEGSFQETIGLVRRARAVLNINNGFTAGGHERVFAAMAGGAAVISDDSAYYAEAFTDAELVRYDWNDLDAAPGVLARAVRTADALASIARAGYERVNAEHLWRHRAAELTRALSAL
jgi:hypothetical protein